MTQYSFTEKKRIRKSFAKRASVLPVPFLLENITYAFDWPDSHMSDAEFLKLICRETGAELLLDVENLYLNSSNHGYNPHEFLDALPAGLVQEIHVAGENRGRRA